MNLNSEINSSENLTSNCVNFNLHKIIENKNYDFNDCFDNEKQEKKNKCMKLKNDELENKINNKINNIKKKFIYKLFTKFNIDNDKLKKEILLIFNKVNLFFMKNSYPYNNDIKKILFLDDHLNKLTTMGQFLFLYNKDEFSELDCYKLNKIILKFIKKIKNIINNNLISDNINYLLNNKSHIHSYKFNDLENKLNNNDLNNIKSCINGYDKNQNTLFNFDDLNKKNQDTLFNFDDLNKKNLNNNNPNLSNQVAQNLDNVTKDYLNNVNLNNVNKNNINQLLNDILFKYDYLNNLDNLNTLDKNNMNQNNVNQNNKVNDTIVSLTKEYIDQNNVNQNNINQNNMDQNNMDQNNMDQNNVNQNNVDQNNVDQNSKNQNNENEYNKEYLNSFKYLFKFDIPSYIKIRDDIMKIYIEKKENKKLLKNEINICLYLLNKNNVDQYDINQNNKNQNNVNQNNMDQNNVNQNNVDQNSKNQNNEYNKEYILNENENKNENKNEIENKIEKENKNEKEKEKLNFQFHLNYVDESNLEEIENKYMKF